MIHRSELKAGQKTMENEIGLNGPMDRNILHGDLRLIRPYNTKK